MSAESVYDGYAAADAFFGVSGESVGRWKVDYFVDHFGGLLPPDPGAAIVDVGCGQGETLAGLVELGYHNWFGVDSSEFQLAIARDRFNLGDRLEKADATVWLRERPAAFDCVLAVDVLEHLPLDELVALGEAIRIGLKPGGRCVVQVPNGIAPMNPIRDGDITHRRAFTVQSLGQLFLLAGLEPVAFRETPPRSRNLAGSARRLVWMAALRPALRLLMLAMHGPTTEAQVFTANMIGVAEKRSGQDSGA